MTLENLSALKSELYNKIYKKEGDVFELINECVRLGMLAERTKDSEETVTIQDVFDEFNRQYE